VFDEIAAIKEACGEARLKVILETGELGTYDKVRLASDIAIAAGADFIKTSTGKINPGGHHGSDAGDAARHPRPLPEDRDR
jgi:deoxyribose-phosphate aldolase